MALDEDTVKKRLAEEAKHLRETLENQGVVAPARAEEDLGDKVIVRDPRVEYQRELALMGMAAKQHKDLLLQVTNLDHPLHALSIGHDLTELEILRLHGCPKEIYNVVKGQTVESGFNGFLRARMGLVYPGVDGMIFHPREQLFSGTRGGRAKEKEEMRKLGVLERMLGER